MPSKRQTAPVAAEPARMNRGLSAACVGADYTEAEIEFIKAMDRYKREKSQPFPTWSEVLGVLLDLGYRKIHRPD